VALEEAGITCWVAPRDILPSQTWSAAIVEAIDACGTFVLVLTGRSNASVQVVREVELASQRAKPILTWRLEAVKPTGALEFFLSATQWQDAIQRPLQPQLQELVRTVTLLLGRAQPKPAPAQPVPTPDDVHPDDFAAPTGPVGGFLHRFFRDR
jgi:hypothetical protein